MANRFEGRNVVVTGAGGGMGRALTLGFMREGAQLILTDVDEKLLAETKQLVEAEGGKCSTHIVNLANEQEIFDFSKEVCAAHDEIYALLNNAGIAYGEIHEKFETMSQEKWLFFLSVNSVAPLILAQGLRAPLAKAKGSIVNQCSMAAYIPASVYGVTKATLGAITYGLAARFGGEGIRVNAVAPGIMSTPASKANVSEENYEMIQSQQMLKLEGLPDDIVKLHLFLASDDARFITGEIVNCDGGSGMRGWRF